MKADMPTAKIKKFCPKCSKFIADGTEEPTTTIGQEYCTCGIEGKNYMDEPRKEYGWICPKCGRANSPLVFECPCTNKMEVVIPNTVYVVGG